MLCKELINVVLNPGSSPGVLGTFLGSVCRPENLEKISFLKCTMLDFASPPCAGARTALTGLEFFQIYFGGFLGRLLLNKMLVNHLPRISNWKSVNKNLLTNFRICKSVNK